MYPERRVLAEFVTEFAETVTQWHAVKRLRYDVFATEMGRVDYANHITRTYSDELDDGRSHAVIAYRDTQPVGTLRFTLRSETRFLPEDEETFGELIGRFNPTTVALADRGVILPEARRSGLYPVMWECGCALLRVRGIQMLLGVIHADNKRLVAFHEREGWRVLSERVTQNGAAWNFIAKDL